MASSTKPHIASFCVYRTYIVIYLILLEQTWAEDLWNHIDWCYYIAGQETQFA